ncbi:MAG: hypothetical protein FWG25_11275, partial [Promicromonosporaceae bacterium]|nr:hypothetical protein [Promicromonosporaceae bacterium]
MAEALTIYEANVGEETGLPSWIATDPRRVFRVEQLVDEAAAVLEAERDRLKNHREHGHRLRVVDEG